MISAKIFSRYCLYALLGVCIALFPIYPSSYFSTLTDMRLYTLITTKLQEDGFLHFQNTSFLIYTDTSNNQKAYIVTTDGDLKLSFEVESTTEDDYLISKLSALPDQQKHRIKGIIPGILKIDLIEPSCLEEIDQFFNNMAKISLHDEFGNDIATVELPPLLRFQEESVKKTLLRESLCQGILLDKHIRFEEQDRLEDNFTLLRRGYYRGF